MQSLISSGVSPLANLHGAPLRWAPALAADISVWLTPIWLVAVGAVVAVGVFYAAYWLLKVFQPKVAAVALVTGKEGISQPLFYVVLGIGAAALLAFPFIPYNTFGEDVKVLADSGLVLIKVLAILVALWTASVSISEEIEGRTALTLLSKPIGRVQFIIGKFLGIIGPSAIIFISLGALFLATVSYKVVYDATENSLPDPTTAQCRNAMLHLVPGLFLGFLETIMLASISVAISTRLPMLANLTICFTIYVLGHLSPSLVESAQGGMEILVFIGQLIATILPVLEYFNMEKAIQTGVAVPISYLAWTTLYALLYSSLSLLVALLLFQDRDLA